MSTAAILEKLRTMKGEFRLNHYGTIRHKTLRDKNHEPACPLVITGQRTCSNGDTQGLAKANNLTAAEVFNFMAAADTTYSLLKHNSVVHRLRRRILKALGLEETA